MEFFSKYTSNTLAGGGNQSFFTEEDPQKEIIGRIYYKVFAGGKYNYSFLFSNVTDSTFADGSHSRKNRILGEWKILSLKAGICSECGENNPVSPTLMYDVTFGGNPEKKVMPGEFFASDEVELDIKKGEYICLEIKFSGKEIPCHEESIIPSFRYENGVWAVSKHVPFPAMAGCDRKAELKIAFWGDSITQGIGTANNSYAHWNAILAEKLGERYAFWNLGLGYARADDAASLGAWYYKAKHSDVVFVCFGVNDALREFSADEIKKNLAIIVAELKAQGIKVILQTLPPFDYSGESLEKWNDVNTYIKDELSEYADLTFDNVPVLAADMNNPQYAKFGGHPNAEGCRVWAEALYDFLMKNRRL